MDDCDAHEVLTPSNRSLHASCRESGRAFERQLQVTFGPRDRESSELTDSRPSGETERGSTEHDRQLDQLLQTQLDSRVQHIPRDSVRDNKRAVVPWYRAFAMQIVSHRDFEFIVICITIVNCVGLALYSPLQPPTNTRNMWMDVIGTYLPAQQLPATH